MREHPRDKALAMAEANPQSAMVFAVLDLAAAVREVGSELGEISKQHSQLAVNVGGIDTALGDLGREIAGLALVEPE
jgi:hypothetical protein